MSTTTEPWVREPEFSQGEFRQVAAFGVDGNRILRVAVESFNPDDDATLIEAAPKLLAALKRVEPLGDVSVFRDIVKALRPHEREAFHDIIADVRAALAAAEAQP